MITKFVHRAVLFFFSRILCYYLLCFTDQYHIKTLNMKCPGIQRRNLKLKNNSNVKFKSMRIKIMGYFIPSKYKSYPAMYSTATTEPFENDLQHHQVPNKTVFELPNIKFHL